jgi:hypothetical protein
VIARIQARAASPAVVRVAAAAAAVGIGVILTAYSVALAPANSAVPFFAGSAVVALGVAALRPHHRISSIAAICLLAVYAVAVHDANVGVDLSAPVYGVLLLLAMEALDLAAEARAGVVIRRGVLAGRIALTAAAGGAGTLVGLVVLAVRPVTGGGLLSLAVAASCGAVAVGLPVRVIRRVAGSEAAEAEDPWDS